MPDLRHGDRVLSVGWDGALEFSEVYLFNRIDPAALGSYHTVVVAGPDRDASKRRLQLSEFHYMPVGRQTGACTALAAAPHDDALMAAWSAVVQVRRIVCETGWE